MFCLLRDRRLLFSVFGIRHRHGFPGWRVTEQPKTWPDVAFEFVWWLGAAMLIYACNSNGGFQIKLRDPDQTIKLGDR
jgi:hypothetical protein